MQTKKRAKPVKFGKQIKKEEIAEKVTKEVAETDIDSEEAKEIKHLIEEKIHPKDEEPNVFETRENEIAELDQAEIDEEAEQDNEHVEQEKALEDEPEEIKLSKEPEAQEDKDEKMALESTDPVTEVEPDELHKKDEEAEAEDVKPSPFGSFTNEEVNRKPKKNYLKFFLFVAGSTFIVGLFIIGGLSYFMSRNSHNAMNITVPTPTPQSQVDQSTTETMTPAPKEVDLSAYSIRVLNGSGTTGEAAKVKTKLTDKGFTVDSVGNAATSDYTKTVLSAKKKVDQTYLNQLIKTLQEDYSVNSVVEDAPSSQTADVVITVGSDPSK